MIARHIILYVMLIVLPYMWVDYRMLLPRRYPAWRRLILWIPCVAMLAFTVILANEADFIPKDRVWADIYLFLLGVLFIPMAFYSICSVVGTLVNHCRKSRWADRTGAAMGLIAMILFVYGFTAGFNRVEVRHLELAFDNLPEAFDGCKVVHVSDLHVGTFGGWRRYVLKATVDSINRQEADYVFFTGDLQNTRPDEVAQVQDLLSQLHNVYAVLGNHDHGEYVGGTEEEKNIEEESLKGAIKDLGWTLLINESAILTRQGVTGTGYSVRSEEGQGDGILIIGTDNDGEPPFPSLADYSQVESNSDSVFSIMLQHDPSAWRRNVLPKTASQLTLSGHTHGGQVGWGPLRLTRLRSREDSGLYEEGGRYLHVSKGAGALIPVRIGLPNEITVITFKGKKDKGEKVKR